MQDKISELIPEEELVCAKDAYDFIRKKDFKEAILVAKFCNIPAIEKMVSWYAINRNIEIEGDFPVNFFLESKKFPDHDKIFKNLEKNILLENNYENILLFFEQQYPQTQDGYNAFVKALLAVEESEYVVKEVNSATKFYFLSNHFNITDFKSFVKAHSTVINQALIHQKIAKLIWNKQYGDAKKIISYADKDYQKMFKARLSFAKNYSRAPRYLEHIIKPLVHDEGLLYNIVKWLEKRDRDSRITKYLLNIRKSDYAIKWFSARIRNARFLIKKEDYQLAYNVVVNHNIVPGGYEYAESEWFAGWIALRFLNKPDIAIKHFKRVYDNVGFAISLSRASYWLGRAYAANNNAGLAAKWYNVASSYSTTYYGQMAILEMKQEVMINLPEFNQVSVDDLKVLINDTELLKIALYYAYAGDSNSAIKFFTDYIKNNQDSRLQQMVVALSTYTNNYIVINKIARYAARFNLITLENYPLVKNVNGIPKQSALIMSIIKQESGFNTGAVSRVGAIGFMQLMPATAREMARRMRISFSKRRLKKDPDYNIKLGTYYMNHLLKRFDQSYILAIASYNAGPTNTRRWMKENGDPRNLHDIHKVIDWVEKVTFSETRNYIQRIMETAVIYLHLIKQNNN